MGGVPIPVLFNSIQYLFYFAVLTGVYFVIPHRFRLFLLLVSSYYFYMCWNAKYIFLLIVFTVGNFTFAFLIDWVLIRKYKKFFLYLSIIFSLGLLLFFKYFNFLISTFWDLTTSSPPATSFSGFDLLLPVGISFYTFQTLSYTIDVYRGVVPVERNFARFALYVSFFPQLVAGPIERAKNLLNQFEKRQYFDHDRIKHGLLLMLWGFFQKVVIADRLAVYVNAVYNHPGTYSGITIWIATIFFAFQIYCDFSGYTDIARGSAKILGFDLMLNFKRPYFATTMSDFWRRWHISLSTWLRDYLYIPLGGNRTCSIRWVVNIMIVFSLCGLWHGASWNFVAWGGLHGFFIVFAIKTRTVRHFVAGSFKLHDYPVVHRIIQMAAVFTMVCFGWIFFRANSLADALVLIKNGMSFNRGNMIIVQGGLSCLQMNLSVILIFALLFVNCLQERIDISELISHQPIIVRWLAYLSLVWVVIIFGVYNNDLVEFIYFQF